LCQYRKKKTDNETSNVILVPTVDLIKTSSKPFNTDASSLQYGIYDKKLHVRTKGSSLPSLYKRTEN
jgi:hypothetical protein